MTLIRPLHDQFQDDCQSCLCCSACSSLPQPVHPWNSPLKSLAPWSTGGNWFFGTWVHLLPRTAGFLNKAIFPFTQHLSLSMGFLSDEKLNLSLVTWPLYTPTVTGKCPAGAQTQPQLGLTCLVILASLVGVQGSHHDCSLCCPSG